MTASPAPDGRPPAARLGRDQPSEQERRDRLDSMGPDALRAMATTMPVIEQAKGVLMGCYGCDATAAFALLVRVSSAQNLKLRELAGRLVDAVSGEDHAAQGASASPLERVHHLLQAAPVALRAQGGPSGSGDRSDAPAVGG